MITKDQKEAMSKIKNLGWKWNVVNVCKGVVVLRILHKDEDIIKHQKEGLNGRRGKLVARIRQDGVVEMGENDLNKYESQIRKILEVERNGDRRGRRRVVR